MQIHFSQSHFSYEGKQPLMKAPSLHMLVPLGKLHVAQICLSHCYHWTLHFVLSQSVPQVAQMDSAASVAANEESTSMVDVVQLMAAVLEDSPSNRLNMLQTSG